VTARDGRILVTVPYGRREDHGWFRQFDCRDVEALLETLGGTPSIVVFSYEREGWQVSDLGSATDKRYRDLLADPNPVADRAAAARAVVCIRVQLQSPLSSPRRSACRHGPFSGALETPCDRISISVEPPICRSGSSIAVQTSAR
jgi:hypothetical protein